MEIVLSESGVYTVNLYVIEMHNFYFHSKLWQGSFNMLVVFTVKKNPPLSYLNFM